MVETSHYFLQKSYFSNAIISFFKLNWPDTQSAYKLDSGWMMSGLFLRHSILSSIASFWYYQKIILSLFFLNPVLQIGTATASQMRLSRCLSNQNQIACKDSWIEPAGFSETKGHRKPCTVVRGTKGKQKEIPSFRRACARRKNLLS